MGPANSTMAAYNLKVQESRSCLRSWMSQLVFSTRCSQVDDQEQPSQAYPLSIWKTIMPCIQYFMMIFYGITSICSYSIFDSLNFPSKLPKYHMSEPIKIKLIRDICNLCTQQSRFPLLFSKTRRIITKLFPAGKLWKSVVAFYCILIGLSWDQKAKQPATASYLDLSSKMVIRHPGDLRMRLRL